MTRRPIQSQPLRTLPKTIAAACYNRVRLALRRLVNPLRIALPGHRGLEAELSDDCRLVVDSFAGDMPILAWCQFQTDGRDALYESVTCELRLYHSHAGLVMGTALEALEHALNERLAPGANVQGAGAASGK